MDVSFVVIMEFIYKKNYIYFKLMLSYAQAHPKSPTLSHSLPCFMILMSYFTFLFILYIP